MNYFKEYLKRLEEESVTCKYDDMYLWPRTPICNDHQQIILKRVGATDNDIHNPISRTAIILKQLSQLISRMFIGVDFSILDICCGDALVLKNIKEKFPNSNCYGADCNIDKFSTHDSITKTGVMLLNIYLQQLIQHPPKQMFDVVLMLNTYRGWESAELKCEYMNLPQKTDEWFAKYAKFAIITATKNQIKKLNRSTHITILGKGEDNSSIICMSKNYRINSMFSIPNVLHFVKSYFNKKCNVP